MKEIYAVSDLHGHYDILKRNLKEAGYDENNENHLLVVCGDCFDRGFGNLEIYKYLKRLTDEGKAIVVKGNHDTMFQNYLDGTSISHFNWMYNGTDKTLDDFLGRTRAFESWCMLDKQCEMTYGAFAEWIEEARKEINEEYPELLSWLKSLPYYYETSNYIFTHGMINGTCEDWRNPPDGWERLTWAKPEDFFEPILNTEKKSCVGHINCGLLRSIIGEEEDDNSIFTRPDGKVIGLDTCTVLTKKVNVLVLEDELI